MEDGFIAAHLESIAGRDRFETDRLLGQTVGRCWPGDTADTHEPAAIEWVRRWRPRGPLPVLAGCSCAAGRCLVCN